MAIRTEYNPFGLTLDVSFSEFQTREGRGRPQTNPIVTLDLSGVSELCSGDVGEKKVRLEAFKLLRNHLAVDAKAVIVEHPKLQGSWILKSEAVRSNVHVKVGSVTPSDDNIFGE